MSSCRNYPKSLPDWVCSDAKILVGGFERGKGKTKAATEKASKYVGKTLYLCPSVSQRKLTEEAIKQYANVSYGADITCAGVDKVSKIKQQYDLVIIDEPDGIPREKLNEFLIEILKWAKQVAVIGTAITAEADCKVKVDENGLPSVVCTPKSNLLYLMLLISSYEDIVDVEIIGEEKMIEDILAINAEAIKTGLTLNESNTIPWREVQRTNNNDTPMRVDPPEPTPRVQQIMRGVQNSMSQATSGLLGRSGPVS